MKRTDGRLAAQARDCAIETNFVKTADGSCLITVGNTKVICTASIEESVPPFLRGKEQGWVTAEYAMLPASTGMRKKARRHSERRARRGNPAFDRAFAAPGCGYDAAWTANHHPGLRRIAGGRRHAYRVHYRCVCCAYARRTKVDAKRAFTAQSHHRAGCRRQRGRRKRRADARPVLRRGFYGANRYEPGDEP